jgi:protein-S-isoprenylcysteine O-methyltransferase Ste14
LEESVIMVTIKLIILTILTIGNLCISWSSLRDSSKHGFYRAIAWEAILILVILNLESWFQNPFSTYQILSWTLLVSSIYLVVEGFRLLKKVGKPDPGRKDNSLIGIEKTTELVTSGIYAYIRHPLYSSLLCLTWGAFLKDPSIAGVSLAGVSTGFLFMTAAREEMENLSYFGETYRAYMGKTKMFIPYII